MLKRYWNSVDNRNYVFETKSNRLKLASDTPIVRHTLAKLNKNPFAETAYFKDIQTKRSKKRKQAYLKSAAAQLPKIGLWMPERSAVKVARCFLRGERSREAPNLPDYSILPSIAGGLRFSFRIPFPICKFDCNWIDNVINKCRIVFFWQAVLSSCILKQTAKSILEPHFPLWSSLTWLYRWAQLSHIEFQDRGDSHPHSHLDRRLDLPIHFVVFHPFFEKLW